jgi:hypothetical protein
LGLPLPAVTPGLTSADQPLIEDSIGVEVAPGVILVGTFYRPAQPPEPWPLVILLHSASGNRGTWQDFPLRLNERGFAVFAFDRRGYGDSTPGRDRLKMIDDMFPLLRYIVSRPEIDPERIVLVGASAGADISLVTLAFEPWLKAAVLLSPGIPPDLVGDVFARLGERPVLVVASEQDPLSIDSARTYPGFAPDYVTLVTYPDAGHGTHMLRKEKTLTATLLDWLEKEVR